MATRSDEVLWAVVRHDDYVQDLRDALTIVAIVPTADEADAEVERLNELRRGRYFTLPGKFFPEGRNVQVGY